MIRAGICGTAGRMGRAVLRILIEREHAVAAAFESPSAPLLGRDAGTLIGGGELGVPIAVLGIESLRGVDCVIDFSSPVGTEQLLEMLHEVRKPVVIGTTGLSERALSQMKRLAELIPVLFSPNMSLGVNLLFKLTGVAASVLHEYDIEIVEAHHKYKKDAPSGTAKRLLEVIKKSVPHLKDAAEVSGRSGITGERGRNEIGVMAIRGGDIVGEHTVFFIGAEERIELTHRASSRDAFARGAVVGMEFLINQKPGLYSMFDVLGL